MAETLKVAVRHDVGGGLGVEAEFHLSSGTLAQVIVGLFLRLPAEGRLELLVFLVHLLRCEDRECLTDVAAAVGGVHPGAVEGPSGRFGVGGN